MRFAITAMFCGLGLLAAGCCCGDASSSTTTRPTQPVTQDTVSTTTTVGGHLFDLDAIRKRVQRFVDDDAELEGRAYRIHSLEFDGTQVSLVMDLQFTPESEVWLKEDAGWWTDVVLATEVHGKYVADLPVNVRTSLWTVFSEDEVLPWGSYRVYDERVLGSGLLGEQKFSNNAGGEWRAGDAVSMLK